MARLYMAGAEIDAGLGAAAQNTGPDGVHSGTVTRDTTVFRSGLASWKCDSSAADAKVTSPAVTFVDGATYWLRGYFRVATKQSSGTRNILQMGDMTVVMDATASISGFAGANAFGSGTSSINDSAWHRIEVKGVATATTTWTAAEILLDGISVATWSGSTARSVSSLQWGSYGGTGALVMNVDDIALNDSTGANNNTYPGDSVIVLLKPTADSAKGTGWTDDAASSTSLFPSVDNTPPLGIADTTAGGGGHMIRNATSNANSNYDATMTTYTAAGVTGTVNAISPSVATAAPVTTSAKAGTVGVASNPAIANINLGATGTAGAFWSGLAGGTFGAGWKWSLGTMTEAPTVTLGTAPVMRITQVTSSTRIADVCFMGMYVDYTPAPVIPPTPLVHQSIPFYPRASRPS